jgi:hypothetical protein
MKISANVSMGIKTLNPRLVRQALYLWWNDCSALALRDEYRGVTVRVNDAKRINWADEQALRPGDLAVTANGVHVLAYVGNQTWVEADPGEWKVLQVKVPAKNPWFLVPVRMVRWAQLQDEPAAVIRPPPGPL